MSVRKYFRGQKWYVKTEMKDTHLNAGFLLSDYMKSHKMQSFFPFYKPFQG